MTTTYIIQIGNSDNKLTQETWANYIDRLGQMLSELKVTVHFFGFSHPAAPWQNCCAVFEGPDANGDNGWVGWMEDLEDRLVMLARTFNQDSIALTHGDTEFIKAFGMTAPKER